MMLRGLGRPDKIVRFGMSGGFDIDDRFSVMVVSSCCGTGPEQEHSFAAVSSSFSIGALQQQPPSGRQLCGVCLVEDGVAG